MKKITAFIFFVFMSFVSFMILLSSCRTNDDSDNYDDSKISVISTVFASYDFTREIAGEHINLKMLLPPGSESHSYEPSPRDIINIQNCDIFIYTGGESDTWVKNILESMDTDNMQIITLMDCVELFENEHDESDEHDGHEHDENKYDEHIWTSPSNAMLIAAKIFDALWLCEPDRDKSEIYKNNLSGYLEKLDALDAEFQEIVDNAERNVLIFGDRFPFRYFTERYNLEYYSAFATCSSESEASAADIRFLIDKVKDEQIPVVFHLELSNKKIAETIAESTGAKVMLLHSAHNITKNELENGVSYIDIMLENAKNIKEALN